MFFTSDDGVWKQGIRDSLRTALVLAKDEHIDLEVKKVKEALKRIDESKALPATKYVEGDLKHQIVLRSMERKVKVRSARYGSLEQFVDFLYSRYVVAFELVSILIFAAIAGVLVLARRQGFMGLETEDGESRGGMFL